VTLTTIDIYSIFFLGFLGTGHCIGMCGPLIFVIPGRTGKFFPHLYYHAGRLLTYTAVGALMGGLGAGMARIAAATGSEPLAWIARTQVGFSVAAAAFLIYFGLSRIGLFAEPNWMGVAEPKRIPGFRKVFQKSMANGGRASMFLIGLLLGFLPCGLSYAAFARALPVGGSIAGAILVLVFGLGTVPGLLLVGTGFSGVARRYRRQSDILSGILMVGMGAHLAVSTLNYLM
jgi:sulfite exporter TauE/SafE